jgi:hypothetical protein
MTPNVIEKNIKAQKVNRVNNGCEYSNWRIMERRILIFQQLKGLQFDPCIEGKVFILHTMVFSISFQIRTKDTDFSAAQRSSV